jgi:SAM-dependent methyltransferase
VISPSIRALLLLARTYFPDPDALIVDVGSGHAIITRHFLEAGYRNIVATDVDPWAAGTAPDGVRFVLADSEKDPLPVADGTADAILLVHLIEHMWNPDAMLADVQRALRVGGVAIVVTPDFRRSFKSFYEDRNHVHPYVDVSLRAAIEAAGLDVVRLTHTNVMRPLGRLPVLWEHIPALLFTGSALLAVAQRSS